VSEEFEPGRPFILFVSLEVEDRHLIALRAALEGTAVLSRLEPGCDVYDVYESRSKYGVRFHLFEAYRNYAAFEHHRDSAHVVALRETFNSVLKSDPHRLELLLVNRAGIGPGTS
jgi:quinol monooxygenase YgiN